MTQVTCPRCGFVQEGGEECGRCGVVFRRAARPASAPRVVAASPRTTAAPQVTRPPEAVAAGPGIVRRTYRVVRWVVLAGLIAVLFLMLRQRPAPEISPDPEAPRRVEAKLNEAARAAAAGQPHTLAMNDDELNAWLHQSLALAPPDGPRPAASVADRKAPMTVEEARSNVRDVRVQLRDDRATIWLLSDFHGKDLTLTLEARISVRDHRLQITPTAGWLGQLPLPRATLERAVARALADPANAEKLELPPDVVDVRIQGGQAFVDYAGGTTAPVELTPVLVPEPSPEPTSSGSAPLVDEAPSSETGADRPASGEQEPSPEPPPAS